MHESTMHEQRPNYAAWEELDVVSSEQQQPQYEEWEGLNLVEIDSGLVKAKALISKGDALLPIIGILAVCVLAGVHAPAVAYFVVACTSLIPTLVHLLLSQKGKRDGPASKKNRKSQT